MKEYRLRFVLRFDQKMPTDSRQSRADNFYNENDKTDYSLE